MLPSFFDWLAALPLYALGAILLATMAVAYFAGYRLRTYQDRHATGGRKRETTTDYDGYIISAVLGLLAILLGFTFSLAIGRFEERRLLVVEQANAIGTAYLRVQVLGAPHRERLSKLLVQYTDLAIALAKAGPTRSAPLLKEDDKLLTDIWAATAAALDSIRSSPFSVALADAMNKVIDMDASRRAARATRVPEQVFLVLWIYLVASAGALGYEIGLERGSLVAAFVLVLLTLSLMLIGDINRPTSGTILEAQGPMEQLLTSLHQPTAVFDRWRGAPGGP